MGGLFVTMGIVCAYIRVGMSGDRNVYFKCGLE